MTLDRASELATSRVIRWVQNQRKAADSSSSSSSPNAKDPSGSADADESFDGVSLQEFAKLILDPAHAEYSESHAMSELSMEEGNMSRDDVRALVRFSDESHAVAALQRAEFDRRVLGRVDTGDGLTMEESARASREAHDEYRQEPDGNKSGWLVPPEVPENAGRFDSNDAFDISSSGGVMFADDDTSQIPSGVFAHEIDARNAMEMDAATPTIGDSEADAANGPKVIGERKGLGRQVTVTGAMPSSSSLDKGDGAETAPSTDDDENEKDNRDQSASDLQSAFPSRLETNDEPSLMPVGDESEGSLLLARQGTVTGERIGDQAESTNGMMARQATVTGNHD